MTTREPDRAEKCWAVPHGRVVYVVRRRRWPWLILFGLAVILVLLLLGSRKKSARTGWTDLRERELYGGGENKVAVIRLGGFFEDGNEGISDSARSQVRDFSSALRKAREDEAVKAVVVEVNSPGGSATASDIMWRRLCEFKECRKPVVALLGDIAASGGYYVIAPADLILAHPTTITGSIGVIIMNFNVEGLMAKLGIRDVTIKAGEHKDILSPFREMSPEERADIQAIADGLLDRFITVVAEGRGLDSAAARALADGSVYTAARAIELGLVDRTGYLEDAATAAGELAGISDPKVVEYAPPPTFLSLIGISTPPGIDMVSRGLGSFARLSGTRALYLWNP